MTKTVIYLAITALLEAPAVLARLFLAAFLSLLFGWNFLLTAFVIGFGPILWSFSALVLPHQLLTKTVMGARQPSDREQQSVQQYVSLLANPPAYTNLYMVDNPLWNAFVIGDDLYLNRDALRTPYAFGLVAHELGHIANGDGRVMLVLRRLTLGLSLMGMTAKVDARTGEIARPGCLMVLPVLFVALFGGGWSALFAKPLWANWMQGREYAADAWAGNAGARQNLIEGLEAEALPMDMATPFGALTRTHPYTELRIDRLLQAQTTP